MIHHEIDTTCPYCERTNHLQANLTSPTQRPPGDGDYALCAHCQEVGRFIKLHGVENLIIRQLTEDEHAELASDQDYAYIRRLFDHAKRSRPK